MLTHYTSLQPRISESYASLYIDSICSANFFTTAYRFSFRVGPTSGRGKGRGRGREVGTQWLCSGSGLIGCRQCTHPTLPRALRSLTPAGSTSGPGGHLVHSEDMAQTRGTHKANNETRSGAHSITVSAQAKYLLCIRDGLCFIVSL